MGSTPVFTDTVYAKYENFGPSIGERLTPSIERFQLLRDTIGQDVRVALVAIVHSFNPGPPATVTVQIATNEPVQWNPDGPDSQVNIQVQQLTPGNILLDVPVSWPYGGGFNLTFPIQPGDECLLIFSDTEIDSWFQNGGTDKQTISPSRRHSLADPIAFFGPRSKANGLPNYSTGSAQLRSDDGKTVIDMVDGQITITVQQGGVTINAPNGTAQVNAQTASVQASGDVSVQGQNVNVAGAVQVKIGSSTVIDGKTFLAHTHSGVQSGGGHTGPVA